MYAERRYCEMSHDRIFIAIQDALTLLEIIRKLTLNFTSKYFTVNLRYKSNKYM